MGVQGPFKEFQLYKWAVTLQEPDSKRLLSPSLEGVLSIQLLEMVEEVASRNFLLFVEGCSSIAQGLLVRTGCLVMPWLLTYSCIAVGIFT